MQNLRDFRPDLRAAVGSLHQAGYDGEAYVLAAAMEGAYASALEMAQAIGNAVRRVERTLGSDIPMDVAAAFQRSLAEVGRVVAALTRLDEPPPSAPAATASGQPAGAAAPLPSGPAAALTPCSSS